MKSAEIRRQFLDFFARKDHTVVPGIPLVPPEDPTLLFTSAGMVPFKNLWAGTGPLPYRRAVSIQRCFRAGGKDSDLENVGFDSRHHTFFEMLGNFSFGDYFKAEAIAMAWEFVTGPLALDTGRLLVSVYEEDEESFETWRRIVPAEKIYRLGAGDNFWGPAGDTGVCGPCSEIYFDRGEKFSCGRPDCRPGCDCERYLEFWNLVFPQFNKNADGVLLPLSRPGIDTGMGLERTAAICQGRESNYDTDLFQPIIERLAQVTGRRRGESGQGLVAFRAAADHARALTFALAENIMPGNDGRGYVIRRILRRAVKFLRATGVDEPVLGELVPVVVEIMGEAYPFLEARMNFVRETIAGEEARYLELLREGKRLFHQFSGEFAAGTVPGTVVFRLHDTHGVPVEVIREIAVEENLALDEDGYRREMERQKAAGRRASAGAESAGDRSVLVGLPASVFRGYDQFELETVIQAVIGPATGRKGYSLVLAETPFYPERGGQAGDRGQISAPGFEFEVVGTRVDETGFIHHDGFFRRGKAEPGTWATGAVDRAMRLKTAANHTATHLLHEALRLTLGDEVKQAGSQVTAEGLRFDFIFAGEIPAGLAVEVEARVNRVVRENLPVVKQEKTLDEAVAEGALALFTEKYGRRVRVVSAGGFSREVCGGTHLESTGQIGLFLVTAVSSIGKGIKRVEALAGEEAWRWARTRCDYLAGLSARLSVEPLAIGEEIERREDDFRREQGRLAVFRGAYLRVEAEKMRRDRKKVGDFHLSAGDQSVLTAEEARQLVDMLRSEDGGVFLVARRQENSAQFLLGLSSDLVGSGLNAREILKETFARLGGGAGGRADFAQAGLKRNAELSEVKPILEQVLQKTRPTTKS